VEAGSSYNLSVTRAPVGKVIVGARRGGAGMTERGIVEYTSRERLALIVIAAVGLIALNGVFIYGVFFHAELITDAIKNPIACAFVVEALVLTGVLAYLLAKWGVSRVHWGWFVVLSLAGGLAFALPVVLLITERQVARGQ
jgi:hypothetical protein